MTIPIFLFVLSAAKTILFSGYGISLIFDDGQMLLNAKRLLEGQVIYLDFQSFFPPIADYHAATVILISQEIVVIRIVHGLLAATISVLIYVHLKKLGVHKGIAIACAIVVILIPLRPDKYYIHAFIIGSFISLHSFLMKGKARELWYGAILIAIASAFRYDLALYSYLAGAATIFLFSQTDKVKRIAWYIFPGAVLWAAQIYVIYASGLLDLFVKQTFTVPYAVTRLIHSSVLIPELPINDLSALGGLAQTALYWFYLFTIVAGGAVFLLKTHKRSIKITLFYSFSIGVLSIFYVLGNMDSGHILKGSMFFVLLIPFVYSALPRVARLAYLICFFLILFAFVLQSIWFVRFYNQKTELGALGPVYLNATHIADTSRPSAQTLKKATKFLSEAKSKNVLALPQNSILYYASEKSDPLVYAAILQGYTYDPFDQEYIVSTLKNTYVQRAVYDPHGGLLAKRGGFEKEYPKVHEYIMNSYEVVEETPEGWLLMVLKPQDG